MLKVGLLSRGLELLCFKPALARLSNLCLEIDLKKYKKNIKKNTGLC